MDEGSFDDIFDAKSEINSETAEDVTTTVETTEATTEANAETTTVENAETTDGQPRDEQGKFASKRNWVPVEALLAERQRREAEATQRAEYEAKLREYEDAARQTQRPDPFENPDDYDRYVQEQVDARLNQRLQEMQQQQLQQYLSQQTEAVFQNFSAVVGNYADRPELVKEALEYAAAYAEQDDAWGHEVLKAADPVARILEEKNRHAQQRAEWEEYQRDPQAFALRKAAELSAAGTVPMTASAPATTMAATAAATRSIASLGGGTASNPTVQNQSEAFDAIFDSKR